MESTFTPTTNGDPAGTTIPGLSTDTRPDTRPQYCAPRSTIPDFCTAALLIAQHCTRPQYCTSRSRYARAVVPRGLAQYRTVQSIRIER
eukprot:1741708-Rhodomonas_salina.1